jgi:hypothetical protein
MIAHLDVTIESKTRGRLDETTNLCTREILGHRGQFCQIDICSHDSVRPHFVGMDVKNLESTSLVRKRDFDVHFQSSRSQECFIDHVHSIGHTNNQYVIELVYTVHLVVSISLCSRLTLERS